MIESFNFPLGGRPINWLWWNLPVALRCRECWCERKIVHRIGQTVTIEGRVCAHGVGFKAIYGRVLRPWRWVKGLFLRKAQVSEFARGTERGPRTLSPRELEAANRADIGAEFVKGLHGMRNDPNPYSQVELAAESEEDQKARLLREVPGMVGLGR